MMYHGATACPNCGRRLPIVARPFGLPSWVCRSCGTLGPPAPSHAMPDSAQVERGRLKAWGQLLASKNSVIRDGEIEDLVAIGPPARTLLADLVKTGATTERAREAMATALGRLGGSEAVNSLLEVLARQERDAAKRRKQRPYIIAAYVAGVLLLTAIPLLAGVHGNAINGGSFSGIIFVLLAARAVGLRRGTAKALGALKEPRAVGPLALAASERKLAATALPILKELLPHVTEEHVAGFTEEERPAIVRLLQGTDYQLVLGALKVVGMFGAQEAREPVERILRDGPPALRAEAETALSKIRGRIELQKDKETLLRASTSVDGIPSDTLLRPATAQPDSEPAQLLRQADSPEDPAGSAS